MSARARPEIDDDPAFQRRERVFQRVGWWLLSGFVTVSALGLFGGGGLSAGTAGDPDGQLRVEYERFIRVGARQRLSIHTRASRPDPRADLELHMNRAYFDRMRVDSVSPEPLSITIGPADVTLRFAVAGPLTVVLDAEPLRAGRLSGEFRASSGGPVTISQFAYF